jgi:hypothetical protein
MTLSKTLLFCFVHRIKIELWVRIPPGAWMFVCCECCVLSGRGLCDKPITRPDESYRMWCVVLCYLKISRMRKLWPALGRSATGKKNRVVFMYITSIRLRICLPTVVDVLLFIGCFKQHFRNHNEPYTPQHMPGYKVLLHAWGTIYIELSDLAGLDCTFNIVLK